MHHTTEALEGLQLGTRKRRFLWLRPEVRLDRAVADLRAIKQADDVGQLFGGGKFNHSLAMFRHQCLQTIAGLLAELHKVFMVDFVRQAIEPDSLAFVKLL